MAMVPRWSRTLANIYMVGRQSKSDMARDLYVLPCRRVFTVAPLPVPVDLNKLFRSKPCSLASPVPSGLLHFVHKHNLFHRKQNKSIPAANVIYGRVLTQVDEPAIYDVFSLERTFRTNFSMLVVHMWLCLRRLEGEGKEGVKLSRNVHEIYNRDLEMRVSKAGVKLLLSKWELEKKFEGNIVAFDAAMLPEAKEDDLQNEIWKNVFAEDGSSKLDPASPAVLAFTRYVRREYACLSLTDKKAMFSGSFLFTPLENLKA